MPRLWISLLSTLLLLTAAFPAAPQTATVPTFETGKTPGREIHIALTGNDSTGDGTAAHPYRTLAHAASLATPGTALRLHSGTYTNSSYLSDLVGTAAAPIWIGGAPGETRPIISGPSEALHLTRVRYLIVHDLEVTNTTDNGINCDDGGDYADATATQYVIFRNLYIHNVGGTGNQDCLKLSGVNDYFVLNSEFAGCGGNSSGSGIDHVGCHNGLIAGNYFHDMSANAVQCKGGSENLEIRANRIVNGGARAINMGGSTDFVYFRPPLSTTQPNAEARNIRVIANVIQGGETPFAFVGCVQCLAAHNTIIDPGNWLMRILQETTTSGNYTFQPCASNRVINNLFYFSRGDLSTYINIGPTTSPETFVFANNLWYAHDTPAQSQPSLPVTETNGKAGQNPLFINAGSANYHLQSQSPALGAGLPLTGVTTDFDDYRYGAPPAIGAFEYKTWSAWLYLPLIKKGP